MFCNHRPLSAPAVAVRRSAESSRNCGGRSWLSWGRGEAWLLQWSASLHTVCGTLDTSLKSREQHKHMLILTDVIIQYKSINWLYVPKCVFYPWEVKINVQQLHLFIDILAVKHAVTCGCYKNNLIALFISWMHSCLSLQETKREGIQVMISRAWMFPHLMCEFNLWDQLSHKLISDPNAAVCAWVSIIPRKVSLSLSSIAGPKLSIRSKSEKVPLTQ